MANYTYFTADLRTGTVLSELPLRDVHFSSVLNGSGSFSASVPINDHRLDKLGIDDATTPRKVAIYVDRDDVLVWGGVIWTRSPDTANGVLQLGGNDFWSYFRRRFIRSTQTFAATDQLTIAQTLINYAQAQTGGDIGVTVGSEVSAILRDRTYWAYERKNLAEAVEQLSAVIDGFDFAIDVRYASGVPEKVLTLSYPRRGRIAGVTGHLFDLDRTGGNIVSYTWPEDGTTTANLVDSIGAGEGDAMLIGTAADTSQIDAGLPLLETVTTYKDITESATINGHAQADLAEVSQLVTTPELVVRADADPILGSYITGDEARIRIDDDWKGGIDTYKRILSISVAPDTPEGEQVTLAMGEAA